MNLVKIRKATSRTDTAIITLPKKCMDKLELCLGDYLDGKVEDNRLIFEKVGNVKIR